MRKTIYAKMTGLPRAVLPNTRNLPTMKVSKWPLSCGKTTVWPATLKMRLCHFTVIYR